MSSVTSTSAITRCPRMFFFFNDTATTEIYTLSLHDALPISCGAWRPATSRKRIRRFKVARPGSSGSSRRSEEHTSELQSLAYLVCRLLLEKKNVAIVFCTSAAPQAGHRPTETGVDSPQWRQT